MNLWQDLRWAARTLSRSPGFTFLAVAILALGIGASSAIFSLMDAVLFRPLPAIAAPEALVDLAGETLSYPTYRSLAQGAKGTARLAAWRGRTVSVAAAGEPEVLRGGVVSGNYFDVLQTRPALGRFFLPADEETGEPLVVLGNAFWKRRFAADPSALGRTLRLNGSPFTVIGVAAEGFHGAAFGVFPDLWLTIGASPRVASGELAKLDIHSRNWGWLSVFGRREAGRTLAQTRAALWRLLAVDASAHGEEFAAGQWKLVPTVRAAAGFGSEPSPALLLATLAGAVAAALLIACANLANLALARSARREREIAIRRALGASRTRLVRQMLTESVLLAVLGGAGGLLIADWMVSAVSHTALPGGISLSAFRPELGWRALAFGVALSAATGIGFGVYPALQASRVAIAAFLRAAQTSSPRSVAKGVFLGAQVALCLALLACAGLLGRSLANALSIDLGFRPNGVLLAQVNLGLQRYDAGEAAALVDELPRRLAGRPGVVAASWTGIVPLSGDRAIETFEAEGYVPPKGARPSVDVAVVAPAYFRTLQIPIAEGREFEPGDRAGTLPVAVINEAMARKYWPGKSPVGRHLTIDTPRRIVGVVRDSRFAQLSGAAGPQAFAPIAQLPTASLNPLVLLVRVDPRASGALAAGAADAIRGEIRRLDPSLPVTGVRPYRDVIAERLLPQRAGSAVLGLFGALSLLLAAFGIYAVVSYSVAQRTREVGIRMALGAQPSDVCALVVRQSATPLVGGLLTGIALAAFAARLLTGLLYGIPSTDPGTFVAVTLLLALCGLAAAYVPARRASRIDPIAAIRNE